MRMYAVTESSSTTRSTSHDTRHVSTETSLSHRVTHTGHTGHTHSRSHRSLSHLPSTRGHRVGRGRERETAHTEEKKTKTAQETDSAHKEWQVHLGSLSRSFFSPHRAETTDPLPTTHYSLFYYSTILPTTHPPRRTVHCVGLKVHNILIIYLR